MSAGEIKSKFVGAGVNTSVRHDQVITKEFVDNTAQFRNETSGYRSGNYHKVASIPLIFVEKWRNEGFDIYKESASAIIKRLKAESLDAFLTTNKKV